MAFGMKKREVPVFLFRGFLDSGKTSFIRETLMEGQFEDGRNTLLILCEEGEEELEEGLLKKNRFSVVSIEDEEDVSEELLKSFDKQHRPHRVMIECNGMWDADELAEVMPDAWVVAQVITTVDSTTFETYLANMKMMVTNQFKDADLVLFNRVDDEKHDRAMFKRMVRAVNRRGQVLFETLDGEVSQDAHEEPPYDINADVIEIADEDYGIFYLDALDNPEKFKGKTVSFKGQVMHPKFKREDLFVPGRSAMTCCAEDIAFVGIPCKYEDAPLLKDGDWIIVKARMGTGYSKEMGGEAPLMIAKEIRPAEAPEEDLVYFN